MNGEPKEAKMDRVREIQQRVEKATPGPWTVSSRDWTDEHNNVQLDFFRYDASGEQIYAKAFEVPEPRTLGNHEEGAYEIGNAEFIANSRCDIPYLLSEVSRLQEELRAQVNCTEQLEGNIRFLHTRLSSVRANACDAHKEMLEISTGSCPFCRAQAAEQEIQRLREISRLQQEMADLVAKDKAFIIAWNAANEKLIEELRAAESRIQSLESELVEVLRLERGDEEDGEYFVPAEPSPVGPCAGIVAAAREFVALIDKHDKENRDRILSLTEAQASREKLWRQWQSGLLEAWARDWRATMTVMLEDGPIFPEPLPAPPETHGKENK